jgi:hypothetical protein
MVHESCGSVLLLFVIYTDVIKMYTYVTRPFKPAHGRFGGAAAAAS